MKKNESFNSKLTEALTLYQDELLTTLPADDELEDHVFSAKFEKKMKKLFKAQRKPYYNMTNTISKRVAIIIITTLIALSTMVMSTKAMRDPLVHFIVETYDRLSMLIFQNKSSNTTIEKIEKFYIPQHMPDGYALSSKNDYGTVIIYEYQNKDGIILVYEQYILDSNNIMIDTENTETQSVKVNGFAGTYFFNKGYHNLLWDDGIYIFSLTVDDSIDKEEVVAIAESVK